MATFFWNSAQISSTRVRGSVISQSVEFNVTVVMNERKESLRPLTPAYIPAYTKERLT